MGDRENKISSGLNKLLKSKRDRHFQYQDIFTGNPDNRNSYLDSFYHAQLSEIASTGK